MFTLYSYPVWLFFYTYFNVYFQGGVTVDVKEILIQNPSYILWPPRIDVMTNKNYFDLTSHKEWAVYNNYVQTLCCISYLSFWPY